jgi:hypothetical protein
MVFAGSVLGLALVMAGLNHWYIGRPTAAALARAGRSAAGPPPPAPPGLAAWGFLALSAALTAALLWTEYAFAAETAARRAAATTIDRALFGNVQPSWAGVAGTVTLIVAVFIGRRLIGARRRHV